MRLAFLFLTLLTILLSKRFTFAEAATPDAQEKKVPPVQRPSPPLPPLPLDFRQLLAMAPAEREKILAARSTEDRQILEGKIREYESLPPPEREARLRSLQLRLYVRPLIR